MGGDVRELDRVDGAARLTPAATDAQPHLERADVVQRGVATAAVWAPAVAETAQGTHATAASARPERARLALLGVAISLLICLTPLGRGPSSDHAGTCLMLRAGHLGGVAAV